MPSASIVAPSAERRRFPLPPSVLRRIDGQLRDDARLLDRRIARLEADLHALGAPERSDIDAVAEGEEGPVVEAIRSRLDAALGRRGEVHRALLRLIEGRFGRCERCGADIRAERLELVPTACRCTSCGPR